MKFFLIPKRKKQIFILTCLKVKNTNLLHNGELKKIGDVIELTEKQAKKLGNVVVEVKETTPKLPTTKTETKTTKTSKGTKTQKDGDNN